MSILSVNSAPIRPSREERLEQIASRIKRSAAETFRVLIETQKNGINNVWENREFTPQEIIDALGADAAKVFQLHGKLTDFIDELSQSEGVAVELKAPKFKFTVSSAGKITVTDQPYEA